MRAVLARARAARFREVVLHGTKDVENEFRVYELYLDVRGSSRSVQESDLAFFGLAGPVTTVGVAGPSPQDMTLPGAQRPPRSGTCRQEARRAVITMPAVEIEPHA